MKPWHLFALSIVLFANSISSLKADEHLADDCVTEYALSDADKQVVDLLVELDSLRGASELAMIAADPTPTCEKPINTGGCMLCAALSNCKSCCIDNFAPPAGTEKKKAGCLQGCAHKWPKGKECVAIE